MIASQEKCALNLGLKKKPKWLADQAENIITVCERNSFMGGSKQ